ncbi:olfactory receptor-like protein OLF4 [Sciurus carolinensis]|uniref:olfactory receptor-like protein OLF4 n=1 Tax=Sciurus carolinensis TaxID=30640 RepID=UPI001FB3A95B|nr:olfactory receptor-like protein OLF4 [Sciurus carolinensis]
MELENLTQVAEFLLLGLSEDPQLQSVLFGLLLTMYQVTVLGKLLIILAVSSDSHLHTPMYFFLSILSLADICSTSTVVPKMLLNIQTESKTITYAGCLAQAYFFMVFLCMDNLLLTVMAYDRYVAICHPLHYMVIMNPRLCVQLVLICLLISTLDALLHTLMLLRLSFCKHLEIPHFFCDLTQILKIACSDTLVNNTIILFATIFLGFGPFSGILFSYAQIVSSILRIPSTGGKYKAFSTCGTHLCVVSLFYGASIWVYLNSAVTDSPRMSAVASVMYTVVTPMLNPFIYSLRNKDMKGALRKLTLGIISILRCFKGPVVSL